MAINKGDVAETYFEIAQLGSALGVRNINELPGCWEHQVDDQWWLAMNGHHEPGVCSKGVSVEPFGVYIEHNGWPAGSLGPGGGIIAAGAVANEDAFIAALKAAAERVRAQEAEEKGDGD